VLPWWMMICFGSGCEWLFFMKKTRNPPKIHSFELKMSQVRRMGEKASD
jgi:hypothetical protein